MNIPTIIIIFITLIPTIIWLIIYYKKDKKEPEPIRLFIFSFILGIFCALFFVLLQELSVHHSGISLIENLKTRNIGDLSITFIFAFLEEFIKASVLFHLMLVNKKEINQHIDGIIYGISLALGFSFAENIAYFVSMFPLISHSEIVVMYLFRTLGTMFAHSLFTGLFGYLITYCMLEIKKQHTLLTITEDYAFSLAKMFKSHFTFKSFRHHVFGKKDKHGLYHPLDVFIESLLIVVILHFIFNLLLSSNVLNKDYMFLSAPFLFLLGSYVFKRFADQRILKQ